MCRYLVYNLMNKIHYNWILNFHILHIWLKSNWHWRWALMDTGFTYCKQAKWKAECWKECTWDQHWRPKSKVCDVSSYDISMYTTVNISWVILVWNNKLQCNCVCNYYLYFVAWRNIVYKYCQRNHSWVIGIMFSTYEALYWCIYEIYDIVCIYIYIKYIIFYVYICMYILYIYIRNIWYFLHT